MTLLQMRQKLIELDERIAELEAKERMLGRIEPPPVINPSSPLPMFLAALPRRRGRPPKAQRG